MTRGQRSGEPEVMMHCAVIVVCPGYPALVRLIKNYGRVTFTYYVNVKILNIGGFS